MENIVFIFFFLVTILLFRSRRFGIEFYSTASRKFRSRKTSKLSEIFFFSFFFFWYRI